MMNKLRYTILIAAFAAGNVTAEEWQFTPEIELSVGQDDNIRLRAVDDAATETAVTGNFTALRATELSETSVDLEAGFTGYSSTDANDLDDVTTFRTVFSHKAKLKERVGAEILASYSMDTVGATARLQSEEVDTDEALTRDEVDRQTLQLRPQLEWDLTEYSKVSTGIDFRRIEYDAASAEGATNLIDYDFFRFTTAYTRNVSERLSLSAALVYSDFDSGGLLDGKGFEGLVSMGFQLTETTSLSFGLGGHSTEISSQIGSDEDASGLLYSASYTRKSELGRLDLIADRALTPSGQGDIVERDALRLVYRQNMSEKFRAHLEVNYVQAENLVNSLTNEVDRRYIFVRPRIDYLLAQDWAVGVSYRFRQNDDKRDTAASLGKNDSNGFFLTLKYEPLRENLRR